MVIVAPHIAIYYTHTRIWVIVLSSRKKQLIEMFGHIYSGYKGKKYIKHRIIWALNS
jgi:hypothetical protein